MKTIMRQALAVDLPQASSLLGPWIDSDPFVGSVLTSLLQQGEPRNARCRILEANGKLQGVSLWIPQGSDEIRLLAFSVPTQEPGAQGLDDLFLREEIIDWSDLGVSKVSLAVPHTLSSALPACFRNCGFVFEGISTSSGLGDRPQVRFSKHLLYKSVPHGQVMSFLKDFMLSIGYEVRAEEDGFGYRIRAECRLPFIFSSWHRITRSGSDIIVHPPARVLEPNELETLFYPLTIRGRNEKPLLLPLEKKRAAHLIDFPAGNNHQDSLFEHNFLGRERTLKSSNLAFGLPAGMQNMRKGLPVLLYVNRMGAVGTARLEDWYLDEPGNVCRSLDEAFPYDPKDVKEHAALSGPHAGKVMVIRFLWYKPLKRVVSFDEIRALDEKFNPQRTRFLHSGLFQSIVTAGSRS